MNHIVNWLRKLYRGPGNRWGQRILRVAVVMAVISTLLLLTGFVAALTAPESSLSQIVTTLGYIALGAAFASPILPVYPARVPQGWVHALEGPWDIILGFRGEGFYLTPPLMRLAEVTNTFAVMTEVPLPNAIYANTESQPIRPVLIEITPRVLWAFDPRSSPRSQWATVRALNKHRLGTFFTDPVKTALQQTVGAMTPEQVISIAGIQKIREDIEAALEKKLGHLGVHIYKDTVSVDIKVPPELEAAWTKLHASLPGAQAELAVSSELLAQAKAAGINPSELAQIKFIASGGQIVYYGGRQGYPLIGMGSGMRLQGQSSTGAPALASGASGSNTQTALPSGEDFMDDNRPDVIDVTPLVLPEDPEMSRRYQKKRSG